MQCFLLWNTSQLVCNLIQKVSPVFSLHGLDYCFETHSSSKTATEMSWDLGVGETLKKKKLLGQPSESRHWEHGGNSCNRKKTNLSSQVPVPPLPAHTRPTVLLSVCLLLFNQVHRSPSYCHPGIKSQLLLAPPFSHAPDALIFPKLFLCPSPQRHP